MKKQWIIGVLLLTGFGGAQADYVSIGNAGNAADSTGYGAVNYEYKISRYEVSIADFQPSGAGDNDEDYWNNVGGTVGSAAPAVYVTLYEAMHYCNYLTSGDVDNGVYSFSGGVYQSTLTRASILSTLWQASWGRG